MKCSVTLPGGNLCVLKLSDSFIYLQGHVLQDLKTPPTHILRLTEAPDIVKRKHYHMGHGTLYIQIIAINIIYMPIYATTKVFIDLI